MTLSTVPDISADPAADVTSPIRPGPDFPSEPDRRDPVRPTSDERQMTWC